MNGAHPSSRRRVLLATLATLTAPAARAQAVADAALTLGTSTPGGGFAQYGEVLERLLNADAGHTLLRAVPTAGTTENLARLRRGELDAALVQGTAAAEVLDAGAGDAGGLRILFAMYPSPGMLAVPAASPARRLEDLRGRRVVFGVRASGLVTLARQVFDGIGLDIERDFDAVFVERAAQSPQLVIDVQAEALWGAGEGWPGFQRLAEAPGGARFIGPAPQQVDAILAKYPLLRGMRVPAGAYPGIEQPLTTVGSVNLILARAGLDDARAAAFVRGMQRQSAALAAALPQAAFSTLANTLAAAPSPALLHPVLRQGG